MERTGFRENVDLTGTIRSILDNYPFSVGLLREILQNSDDAEASEQIFLLDRRLHATDNLCDPGLAASQGPALLAFNNASFQDRDWIALRSINNSSKRTDTSKIGKFGIGIRSCYHVTDHPQILSGSTLVVFDPRRTFSEDGGERFDFGSDCHSILDQFSPFRFFLGTNWKGGPFSGTILRLPLRAEPGEIRDKIVTPAEISQLFHDFIKEELNISLLFLRHLRSIKILEINEDNTVAELATCIVSTIKEPVSAQQASTSRILVKIDKPGSSTKETWRVIDCSFSQSDALSLLSARSGSLSESALTRHKLLPNVGLAFPLNDSPRGAAGNLFTFLRLPLTTGFPAHAHALFALTPSRQNLRNAGDNGYVKGSDDMVLIEWNRLLFEVFIPRAWSRLLTAISQRDGLVDIFRAWPSTQSSTQCGESVYWRSFPQNILKYVLEEKAAVWPVHQHHDDPSVERVYKSLESVMIATSETPKDVVDILAVIGVEITCPPKYIADFILALSKPEYVVLNPATASKALLNHVEALRDPTINSRLSTILTYLLSTGDVTNIADLPLVPLNNGQFVALSRRGSTRSLYTLLEVDAFRIFVSCDETAIPLHVLSPGAAATLRQYGPQFLNVKELDADQVVLYLALHPNRLGLDLSLVTTDALAVKWLSSFWSWFHTWRGNTQLLPKLRPLYLLPCYQGLQRADQPVFLSVGQRPTLVQQLSAFGVPFLHSTFDSTSQKVLTSYGLLKPINDIHALLTCLASHVFSHDLDEVAARLILDHLSRQSPSSCLANGPFTTEQRQTLKRLPIYPLTAHVLSEDGVVGSQITWAPIPEDYAVVGVGSSDILPTICNHVYIDCSFFIEPSMLRYLGPAYANPLTDIQLLSIAVDQLDNQPQYLQAHFVSYIVSHRRTTPQQLLDNLKKKPFVFVLDGSQGCPANILDPASDISVLYPDALNRIPRLSNGWEEIIVDQLSSLDLLDVTLSAEGILERIRFIDANASSASALTLTCQLLQILDERVFDCRRLSIGSSLRWLPTRRGLLGSAECRDKPRNDEELALFDQVLELVDENITIPSTLRKSLGWDQPISNSVLVDQLEQVLLQEQSCRKVTVILRELSKRQLTHLQLALFREITANHPWVPTSGGHIVETAFAVFSSPIPNAGIHQISYTLRVDAKGRAFLLKMGCSEKPTCDAILQKLSAIGTQSRMVGATAVSVDLLRSLPEDLSDANRSRILVPDRDGHLRPIAQVYFNDIGDRAILVHMDNSFLAHPLIDESLARTLKLERLGLKFVHLQLPTDDMGTKPVTIVRNTLTQYAPKQLVTESLANAEDANASSFALVLNDFRGPVNQLLSPTMSKFYDCPSLIIYNNSVFSEKDFSGICRTNIGGKVDDPNSIGQFGLGALTMFHFSELAIIVSGDQVLFLDPSKTHLPVPDRASLKMPLKDLLDWYPGHLDPLNGLPMFEITNGRTFNGTIFMLPLRNASHICGADFISDRTYTVNSIKALIINDFIKMAAECFLFTCLEDIDIWTRTPSRPAQRFWSASAESEIYRQDNMYQSFKVTITQSLLSSGRPDVSEWIVTSGIVLAQGIPENIRLEKMKQIRIGLAAPLGNTLSSFKFFSTLPLAIPTSLPVHVNATFRLSQDRRQIRLDRYDSKETSFNRWLLSNPLPQLYLSLLEDIAQSGDNRRLWPGIKLEPSQSNADDSDDDQIPMPDEDPLTTILLHSFYSSHISTSTRRIFRSAYSNSPLTIKESVFFHSRDAPRSVNAALSLLKPGNLVKLSSRVQKRVIAGSSLQTVTPAFVRDVVARNPDLVTGKIPLEEVGRLIRYLIDPNPGNVYGLPLLLLADGHFVNFNSNSQSTPYYLWRGRRNSAHLFPPNRFIDSSFATEILMAALTKAELNVAALDSTGIKLLLQEQLGNPKLMSDLNELEQQWVGTFWAQFPFLPQTNLVDAISTFPLVPTLKSGEYVSLAHCKKSEVIIGTSNEEPWLWQCFQRLGLTVIQLDGLPSCLRDILRSNDYPMFTFHRLLSAIKPNSSRVADSIESWGPNLHKRFAKWARGRVIQKPPADLKDTARHLPIWRASRMNQDPSTMLCPASEVVILPLGLTLEATRFFCAFATEDSNVKYLDVERLSFSVFRAQLDLPRVLHSNDEGPYKRLLDIWVREPDTQSVPVPNANRVIVPSNTLYTRSPLFEAAFGRVSAHFILNSFRNLEQSLLSRGLRSQAALNMDMFQECAQALHDAPHSVDKVARAAVVYRSYSEDLPLRVETRDRHHWLRVDNLQFIPRSMGTVKRWRLHELAIPDDIQSKPEVVAPRELLRAQYHDIAWSQKATFAEEPNQRVLLAYSDLGVPSSLDVVQHLRALSQMRQGPDVLHYLTETYKWLEENEASVRPIIVQYNDEPIFLNVDKPETEEWRWEAANQLAFEVQDVAEIHCVREFLQPFKKLLRAAGVIDVIHPDVPSASPEASDIEQGRKMREGFALLRANGDLTDVLFVTAEDPKQGEDAPEPLVAHRTFLSVFSDYFKDMFCGGFNENREASTHNPVLVYVEHSRFAVETVLDHLYTGVESLSSNPDIDLEELLQVMELSNYWAVENLFSRVQIEIGRRRLIDPTTLGELRSRAEPVRGEILLGLCDRYEAQNSEYIRRVLQI